MFKMHTGLSFYIQTLSINATQQKKSISTDYVNVASHITFVICD